MISIYGISGDISYEELGAIELLRSNGCKVQSILPPSASDGEMYAAKAVLSHFAVDVVRFQQGMFASLPGVISFGNPELFDLIRSSGERPAKVVYGCSYTAPSSEEISAVSEGLVDEVFTKGAHYSVRFIRDLVLAANRGVEHRAGYTPFCNPDSKYAGFTFSSRRDKHNVFRVIRDTPDDESYCFPDHWRMVSGIVVPSGREKQFSALNWGDNLSEVAGNPTDPQNKWYDESPVEIVHAKDGFATRRELFSSASVLLHYFPAYEAFPYGIALAMLTGVAVVSGPSPAALELIEHGKTGYIADSADEAAYYTSRLAWKPELRDKLAVRAYREFLTNGSGNPDVCLNWWRPIMSWQT